MQIRARLARASSTTDNRPSVLHVIDALGITGGAERQLVANLRKFDHSAIRHELAVVKPTRSSRVSEVADLVDVHQLIPEGGRWSRKRVIKGLLSIMSERKPDLVHASLPEAAMATRIAARVKGVPAVESLVNISHEPLRTVDNPNVSTAKLRAHTVLDRVTMSSLVGFHAVSQRVADSWVDVVGLDRDQIQVIPRGVDHNLVSSPNAGRQEARLMLMEELGLPSDSLLIVSVGRLEPQKGHRYLIEAMPSLLDRVPESQLLVVGRRGHATNTVESAIEERGLAGVVHLIGPRTDIAAILAAADIFAFPSLFEGNGGNAMIEAMAAGLPIITTRATPMTDLVPDDSVGLLVDRLDVRGLAEALSSLAASSTLRAQLGAAARQRVLTFPTVESVAAMHEAWYRELLR